MSTAEPLDTPEKINAVMAKMVAGMPGWEPPAAYGVTLVHEGDSDTKGVHFPVVNVGVHGFPALALAEVTGRRSETATYRVTSDDLQRCIDIVAPAEAATMYQHPNLNSWRALLAESTTSTGGQLVVVFIADLADPVSSSHDEALRRQIAEGERAALYS